MALHLHGELVIRLFYFNTTFNRPLNYFLEYVCRCFVWATVCHCTSIWWSHRTEYSISSCRKNRQASFSPRLRWLSHLFFVLPLILVIAFASWGLHIRYTSRVRLEQVLSTLRAELQKAGEAFDPELYDPRSILEIIAPAKRLKPIPKRKFHIYHITFLCSNLFLLTVYLPLMLVSWRDLSLKSKVLALRLQNTSGTNSSNFTEVREVIKDMRTTLIYRALPMVLDLFASTPGICWVMHQETKRVDIFRSGKAHATVKFIFDIPIMAALNIHLLIVAWHSKNKLKAYRQAKAISRDETAWFSVMSLEILDSGLPSKEKAMMPPLP
ncbi:hypothetical protein O181_010123 [Austropuccinia psidii MF-1]|uniref:Uncharacterized protein n=1 Tax=Austropuccinia psidii MF-1 TaxID=1389203 RepID=A0A9Q3GK26_9BASI|nr:hypothetical protein [Austropuccinia psidii MF-1]